MLPPKQKVAEQKKLADERLVASYVGKEVKTDQDGGDSGVILAMVRRKVGKTRQWRIQVQWKKGGATCAKCLMGGLSLAYKLTCTYT